MKRIIASLSSIMLVVLVSSFQMHNRHLNVPGASPVPVTDSLSECENVVYEYFYTSSAKFRDYADTLYKNLFSGAAKPSRKVFDYALKGYAYFSSQEMLGKKDLMAFIDYSLSSNIKRLWVVDLKNVKILYHELVAHGRNTGEEYARKFSNAANSFQTSLGFFITGEIYNGKHELSVKMNGMEQRYNSKAFDRGIVMHGADYVSQEFISQHQRLGRSLGCPAVSQNVISRLSGTIANGVCLFAYYPNKTYLKTSKVLKSDALLAVAR